MVFFKWFLYKLVIFPEFVFLDPKLGPVKFAGINSCRMRKGCLLSVYVEGIVHDVWKGQGDEKVLRIHVHIRLLEILQSF